ncbi:DUF2845 domain-containing protein [Dyella sp. LX-66]|uniref:DUF2845 domain-containing protein n=1 Tax=unclassified Dyella TaxID=2634549 RepID=UPI001BDFE14E|nr:MULTISPECIES: DUF2845 domain-containing protein [unclassified Dyella]MBT2115827.1 DUF2845 domain-containing protein [Dyella sp. LX-1]MBT2139642.1 DUF2845 domain-containing protein [Dyella sp. LX-66]
MRFWMWIVLCLCAAAPAWADSLRVGQQVLVTGDSAARVVELLGQPVHKASGGKAGKAANKRSAKGGNRAKQAAGKATEGERWQYRQGRRTVTVVLVQGKVARIE